MQVDLWGGQPTQRLGVGTENRLRPIHRWYPFIEGYSSDLVHRALATHLGYSGPVFDPFGGSGTTALAAAQANRDSYFAEVNPFLSFVADAKVNQVWKAARDSSTEGLLVLATLLETSRLKPLVSGNHPLLEVDSRRQFFPAAGAATALAALNWIATELAGPPAQLGRLAVATSLIRSSNMIRRADLRRRTPSDSPPAEIRSAIATQLRLIVEDVRNHGWSVHCPTVQVGGDVRKLDPLPGPTGLVITSPPYLNGTNYSRNTKLEMLALGFVKSEADLSALRDASISAGINYVSSRRAPALRFDAVESVANTIERVAYDARIPTLVRNYFSDMHGALQRVRNVVSSATNLYLDIGDSRFCGIHVPTDDLLVLIAEDAGWRIVSQEHLRERRSFDGSLLRQTLLHFEAR